MIIDVSDVEQNTAGDYLNEEGRFLVKVTGVNCPIDSFKGDNIKFVNVTFSTKEGKQITERCPYDKQVAPQMQWKLRRITDGLQVPPHCDTEVLIGRYCYIETKMKQGQTSNFLNIVGVEPWGKQEPYNGPAPEPQSYSETVNNMAGTLPEVDQGEVPF